MAHGGARKGAGRKRGVDNALTLRTRRQQIQAEAKAEAIKEVVREVRKKGDTPLEYMLSVMRDDTVDNKRRDAMAAAAAPYLHPRLSNATLNVKNTGSLRELTTDELIAALQSKRDSGGTAEAEEGNGRPN